VAVAVAGSNPGCSLSFRSCAVCSFGSRRGFVDRNGCRRFSDDRGTAFAGLQHDQLAADRDLIAGLAAERQHPSGDRRGHLDDGFVGRHFHHRLVFGDLVADLYSPGDDLG
jgi:hypothetical protein